MSYITNGAAYKSPKPYSTKGLKSNPAGQVLGGVGSGFAAALKMMALNNPKGLQGIFDKFKEKMNTPAVDEFTNPNQSYVPWSMNQNATPNMSSMPDPTTATSSSFASSGDSAQSYPVANPSTDIQEYQLPDYPEYRNEGMSVQTPQWAPQQSSLWQTQEQPQYGSFAQMADQMPKQDWWNQELPATNWSNNFGSYE